MNVYGLSVSGLRFRVFGFRDTLEFRDWGVCVRFRALEFRAWGLFKFLTSSLLSEEQSNGKVTLRSCALAEERNAHLAAAWTFTRAALLS